MQATSLQFIVDTALEILCLQLKDKLVWVLVSLKHKFRFQITFNNLF
jgi:hypothetical protein